MPDRDVATIKGLIQYQYAKINNSAQRPTPICIQDGDRGGSEEPTQAYHYGFIRDLALEWLHDVVAHKHSSLSSGIGDL